MRVPVRQAARFWLHGIEAGCVAVPRSGGAALERERAVEGSRALRAWFDRNGGGHCDAWAVLMPDDGDASLGYDLTARLAGVDDGRGERLARSLVPTYRHESGGVGVALWGDARRVPPDASVGRSLPADPARLAALYVHARLAGLGLASPLAVAP
ncbi:MAG: hypothetical protein KJT01_16355 [Gemmatimonadetes bacterium]|jgi:GNAT superfamily N-acetyltransferase|nr:hypothetical protein [Gemmatimonadota bacterium]